MEHFLLLLLSFVGFVIAWYIHHKTSRNEKLVCVIGEDCDKVVNSKYGRTFGVDNTIGGMIYYGLIFAASVLQIFIPVFFELSSVFWARILISGVAASFSIYLIYVQLLILKEWCEYCLASAAVNILIFIIVLV